MKKFLLATPRSGSTMVMDILDQMGIDIPTKYAHFHAYNELRPYLKDDGTIGAHPSPKTGEPLRWCDRVRLLTHEEMMRRIDIMRRATPDYLFKFFPSHLDYGTTTKCSLAGPPREDRFFHCSKYAMNDNFSMMLSQHPVIQFLSQECECFGLIRRNKMAQFLSFMKARRTNVYAVVAGDDLPPEPNPSAIDHYDFDMFFKDQVVFTKISKLLNIQTLFYEDFIIDPSIITRTFGLDQAPVPTTLRIQRTNYDWVQNLDEVKRWFVDWSLDE